ncbi:MAG: type VI secretion system tip protein TssI/VgrG [Planctomycetota bacterium]
MIKLSQENRQARIDTPLGEDVLLLQHFSGTEALSKGFAYEMNVVSKDDAIDGNALVGKRISVSYYNDLDGRTRYFNGFVSRFEYAEQVEEPTRMTSYHLTMVPWLWFLRHNKDCQIFQDMTVPDIIKQIFQELGFSDFQVNLTENYSTREYCVQYRETDFDFVSRLMEEEGIFYYFTHTKDKHTLVLCDSPSGYYQLDESEVRYTPIGQKHEQQLSSWRHVYEFRPGKIAQKDFNFKTPSDGLLTDKKSRVNFEGNSNLEIYEYPGRYEENGIGDRLTKVRLEELEAEHDHVTGSGYYLTFSPGGKFKVDKHSRKSDEGKSFALVEVYTELNSNFGFGNAVTTDFENQFRCIPAETTFRSPRETQKPVVEGPQTAIVVTDGQEIVVDEHARVKVQFHWDRYGKNDVNSSCWIRVSQVHAGAGWGMIDIPRKDEEVIVSFLDGDPDRPIITGRVYNGQNQPPFGLSGAGANSKNKKRRGNTTKTYEGSGYNEMTMDDTDGEEEIRIHAQYDMNSVIEHDETWHTKNDRTKKVDNDETMTIGNDQKLTVVNNKSVTVQNNHTEMVAKDQTITIGQNRTDTVGQNEVNTIGQNQTNTIGAAQATAVGGAFSLTIGSAMTTTVNNKQTNSISSEQGSAIGSNQSTQVGGNQKTVVGGDADLTVAGKSVETAREITISAGMKVTIQAGAQLALQCGACSIEMNPAMITIKGPLVKINC